MPLILAVAALPVAGIIIVIGIVLFAILVRTNSLWLVNRLMSAGAVIGFFIGASVVNLVSTANHRGTGIVRYGGGGDQEGLHPDAPEFDAEVSESQYKREKFVENGIMLGIALLAWWGVAKTARNETVKENSTAG